MSPGVGHDVEKYEIGKEKTYKVFETSYFQKSSLTDGYTAIYGTRRHKELYQSPNKHY